MTQTQMTAYLADKIGITKRQAKSALSRTIKDDRPINI
jgi:nucleoid DNA-binding protein